MPRVRKKDTETAQELTRPEVVPAEHEFETPIATLEFHPGSTPPTTEELRECVEWLERDGLKQPLDVWPLGSSGYLVLDGRRRMTAANRLGWTQIRVRVRPFPTRPEADAFAVSANNQRRTETDYRKDEWATWLDAQGYESRVIGGMLREPASTVRNRLRIAKLPTGWRLTENGDGRYPRRVLQAASRYANRPEVLAYLEATGRLSEGPFADEIAGLVERWDARKRQKADEVGESESPRVEESGRVGQRPTASVTVEVEEAEVQDVSPDPAPTWVGLGPSPSPRLDKPATAASPEPAPAAAKPKPADAKQRAELLQKMRVEWLRGATLRSILHELSRSKKRLDQAFGRLLSEVLDRDAQEIVSPIVSFGAAAAVWLGMGGELSDVWRDHAGSTKTDAWRDFLAFHDEEELRDLCDQWNVAHAAYKKRDQVEQALTVAPRAFPPPPWLVGLGAKVDL